MACVSLARSVDRFLGKYCHSLGRLGYPRSDAKSKRRSSCAVILRVSRRAIGLRRIHFGKTVGPSRRDTAGSFAEITANCQGRQLVRKGLRFPDPGPLCPWPFAPCTFWELTPTMAILRRAWFATAP